MAIGAQKEKLNKKKRLLPCRAQNDTSAGGDEKHNGEKKLTFRDG